MATFTYTVGTTESAFPLRLYDFILGEIRRLDQTEGGEFLKRYLSGPQALWEQRTAKALALKDMWSIEKCPDEYLVYLKWIVGWTSEPNFERVTKNLDPETLRRLIAASGSIWQEQGPEETMLNALRIITGGARSRYWNWFDFRWVLDETGLGEEHDGRDPWIINLPSSVESERVVELGARALSADGVTVTLAAGTFSFVPDGDLIFRLTDGPLNGEEAPILNRNSPYEIDLSVPGVGSAFPESSWAVVDQDFTPDDEYRSNLRIVDNGSLDRDLLKRMIRLMRAANERWEITYLTFLDLFNVEGDNLQWGLLGSGDPPTVAEGVMQLRDDTVAQAVQIIVDGSAAWTEYLGGGRIKGVSGSAGARFGIQFYWTDTLNYYQVDVDTAGKELRLVEVLAGAPSVLALLDLNFALIDIIPDIFYLLRFSVLDEAGQNRIQVAIDGAVLIDVVVAANHTAGTVGFFHDLDATLDVDELEVTELPTTNETLDINTVP